MPEPAASNASETRSQTLFHLQQALKLALSLTLFYWLALAMDWDLPKYGATAIVIVSLGTTGATIEKGIARFVGTTVGVAVGFLILGLFCHDRWATMLALAAYITAIGYFMQTSRYSYAWYVAAFVPLVVWADNYPNFAAAFTFGTFRWLETTVGILIYTTVDLVFWPRSSGDPLTQPGHDAYRPPRWDFGRFVHALFPPTAFIAAFLLWVFIHPPPGPAVPMMTGIFALAILRTPMNPAILLVVIPICIFLAVAPVYWLVMPGLSTGVGLLSLVFVYSFVFGYLGRWSPALKLGPLILFVSMTGISNRQRYSFNAPVDGALMLLLAVIVVAIVYSLFGSMRPAPGGSQRAKRRKSTQRAATGNLAT